MPTPRAIFAVPYVIAQERLTRSDLERTPEPMVMDEPASVTAFHGAGSVEGPNVGMYEVCARAMSRLLPEGGSVLDLGSGSGRYLAHLARHRPDVRMVGLDLSQEMIATGRRFLDDEGLGSRISLHEADITTFAADLCQRVDVISSIWALHQLPTLDHLDACLAQIAAIREDRGCGVFLADFARLRHPRSFPLVLSAVSRSISPTLKADGIASERAAWTLSELTDALKRAGLGDFRHCLSSPIRLLQVHWSPARSTTEGSDQDLWCEVSLPRGVRFDAAFWWRSIRRLPRRTSGLRSASTGSQDSLASGEYDICQM